jgi:hypothetical protein
MDILFDSFHEFTGVRRASSRLTRNFKIAFSSLRNEINLFQSFIRSTLTYAFGLSKDTFHRTIQLCLYAFPFNLALQVQS